MSIATDSVSVAGSQSRLDVCLASPIFHPEYSGGAERFRRYAPGLRQRGIEMSVVATTLGTWKPYRRYAQRTTGQAVGDETDGDVEVERIDIPRRNAIWERSSIRRHIAMWRNQWLYESGILERCRDSSTRPDLIVWRYPLSMASLRALIELQRLKVPMIRVVTVFQDPGGPGWKGWLKARSFPVPFSFLDCVVVSSEAMRENLRRLGVNRRIEVVSHGVDLTRFRPPATSRGSAQVRHRHGLDPEDEVVLFVGPLNQRKGIDYLAAAWDQVAGQRPRAHLLIVGPERKAGANEEAEFVRGVRETLTSGRGRDRVTFVGRVQDVEEYMRAADVFVLPTHREGMPNVVLEAFASGLPSVLTPFRGLPEELGRPGQEYVLVEHDVSLLGQAIVDLLSDASRREQVGQAAFRWAREQLDLEKSLDRLAEILNDVARTSGRV